MDKRAEKIINDYYVQYDEDGRLLSRHGNVEFITTMTYVEKYLKKGDTVLEVGAGTGRYSHALARAGYKVDAVDLVEHNIELFKANTAEGERVTIRQGNALDLSFAKDDEYDITLLLGPMYHLFTVEEQIKALSEAIRVTKRGGKVFVAYCGNDATVIQFYFGKNMAFEPPYDTLVDKTTFKASSNPEQIFVLYCKEDVDKLMSRFKIKRLHFLGTDMATNYMRETIDAMSEETYGLYLKYVLATCEREDLVGASHHFLDIFEKL